jgi:sugar lactone lactonase YvrE
MNRIGTALALAVCMAWPGSSAHAARPGQELYRFGREGIGPAQMSDVRYVALDPRGFLYTVDNEVDRIQRFDLAGKLQSLFYAGGTITSIAVDRDGSLYMIVYDRLFHYDPSDWTLLGEIQRVGRYEFYAVAARRQGGIVAFGEGGKTEILFIQNGKVERVYEHPTLRYVDRVESPTMVEDAQGFLYVADNFDNQIQKIGPDGRFIGHFGSRGDEPGQFSEDITGLAIDADGQLWIADSRGFNVFTTDGRFLYRYEDIWAEGVASLGNELYATQRTSVVKYALGRPGSGEGGEDGGGEKKEAPSTKRPWDLLSSRTEPDLRFGSEGDGPGRMVDVNLVAVDPHGFLYTGDAGLHRITRFKLSGEVSASPAIGKPGKAWTGLAADRDGILYVVADNRLFRYSPEGKLLGEVKHPDGAGFHHVAPRPDNGAVATWHNAERDDILLLDRDGAIEAIHRNAVSGAVGSPAGETLVAMDGRQNIYVAVPGLHILCAFNFQGEYQNRFGSEGEEPGQISGTIGGLTVDGQENVFVADGKRVNVFHGPDARFLRRVNRKATALAITDDDDVLASDGTEVSRLPGS